MERELPAFVEVEPHAFMSIGRCNRAEILAALKHETDGNRRRQISGLLREAGDAWKEFPLMTVEDMFLR